MHKLRLDANVWAKILFLLKQTDSEVSGFGISSQNDLFHVTDFHMVEQEGSAGSTEMSEDGIAAYTDRMLEKGLEPCEFMRIWVHTHPKGVNGPSATDITTMKEVFGNSNFAVMLIVTQELKCFCELWINMLNTTFKVPLDLEINWGSENEMNPKAWKEEFNELFSEYIYTPTKTITQYSCNGKRWNTATHRMEEIDANGNFITTQQKKTENGAGDVDERKGFDRTFFSQFNSPYLDDDEIIDFFLSSGLITPGEHKRYQEMLILNKDLPDELIELYKSGYAL